MRTAIEAGNARFAAAFDRRDAAAIGGLYSTDAQAFPPQGDVVGGQDAIVRFWKGVMDAGIQGVTVATVEVEVHGDTAHEGGTYTLVGDGGATVDAGT